MVAPAAYDSSNVYTLSAYTAIVGKLTVNTLVNTSFCVNDSFTITVCSCNVFDVIVSP